MSFNTAAPASAVGVHAHRTIMATVELDTVSDSSGALGPVQSQVNRGFIISDIDTDGMQPYDLLPSVVDYLPDFNTFHPSGRFPMARLTRIEVQGVLPNAVTGRLIYANLDGTIDGSAYVLTRSSRTIQTTGNVLPNGQLISASYEIDEQANIPETPITMTFRRPCSTLTAEGIRYGSPEFPGADYIGCVNQSTWQGRNTGCWLLDDFTTAFAKYANTTSFRAVVLGNVLSRNWASVGVLKSTQSGRFVHYDGMEDDITADLNSPYTYGQYGTYNYGYAIVGPYPTVDFNSLGL